MIKRQNFHLILGNSKTLRIPIETNDASLAGATFRWFLAVSEDATGDDIKVTKTSPIGITLDGETLIINLSDEDTADLPELEYFHEAEVDLANGEHHTLCKGRVSTTKTMRAS